MKIENLKTGKSFTKEGKTYVIIGKDNIFTYASCTNGDGFRYLFVNGIDIKED